jgi:hypothetical protein
MKSQLLGAVSAGLFAFTTLSANAALVDNGDANKFTKFNGSRFVGMCD